VGLAEKRLSAAYQKENFPAWKEKLNALVTYELDFVVAWDEIVKEGFPDAYPATLDYNFFQPLFDALTSVCRDDIGRESLQATIREIKIGSQRPWSSLQARVEGNTLELDADPTYERTEAAIKDYGDRILKVLEAAL